MDDKLFDLMTQMYADLKEFKENTEQNFKEIRSEIQQINSAVIRILEGLCLIIVFSV